MRLQFLGLAVVTGVGLAACSSGGNSGNFIPGSTAGSSGSAGSTATAGSTGSAGSTATGGSTGTAGSTATGGSTGTAGAGTAGATSTAGSGGGAAGSAGGADGGAGSGTGGSAVGTDLTTVIKSAGCGMDPGQAVGSLVMHTIQTMGTMLAGCADANCSATKPTPWSYARNYWVRLPTGYDNTKAYPIVFEGPGCGGAGNNLYNIPIFDATVIRVGLSPSKDAQVFHATNPGQGCFDDKNDDSSVDWPFYETLYDQLASTLCFDRNRVFAGGNSSGAWFSNELGCKYAGDAKRPVRGIMPNTGGLPTDPKYVPTCTTKPMAGFWSHEVGDPTNPFSGNIIAMDRALQVNGCTVSAGVTETYENATTANNFMPFPVGTDTTSCKRYKGCPDLTPMVVCPLPGNNHASHDAVVDPGWPAFLSLFSMGDLITQ
jgi:poly(3-hydroxybutyrate) depolymerase